MTHNSICVYEYFGLTSTPTIGTPYKEFHQRFAWILPWKYITIGINMNEVEKKIPKQSLTAFGIIASNATLTSPTTTGYIILGRYD